MGGKLAEAACAGAANWLSRREAPGAAHVHAGRTGVDVGCPGGVRGADGGPQQQPHAGGIKCDSEIRAYYDVVNCKAPCPCASVAFHKIK